MPQRTCDHLKEDGVYCSSLALRNQRYCYFHLNIRARRVQAAHAQLHGEPCRLHMPVLDNMHAIQAGIQQVLDALADNRIPNRRASLLLYALQQAATSLKTTPQWQGQRPEVAADEPLRALAINELHEQYNLPYDTDFDAPPEVAAAKLDVTSILPPDARYPQTRQQSLPRNPVASDANGDPEGGPQLPSVGNCWAVAPSNAPAQDPPRALQITWDDLPPTQEDLQNARKKPPVATHPAPATVPADVPADVA